MRKILTMIFILALSAHAYGQEAEKPVKIGFIDMQRALNESEAGKNAKAELEKMFRDKQKAIDERIAQREKLVAELEKQAVVLSEEARRQKQDALDKLTRDLERMISDTNAELQKSQRELEIGIFRDLDKIIRDIGESGGYTVILPSEALLYSTEGIDLTDSIIAKHDELYRQKPGKGEK